MTLDPPRLRTVAVVLAGGTGSRVGTREPKQLLKIAGRTILEHSITAFEESGAVDEIIVLMAVGWVPDAVDVVSEAGFRKVSQVLAGGSTRAETTRLALSALGDDDCNVLLHDAARPLVEQRIIHDCVVALETYQAVGVAIRSADTIVEVVDGTVRAIPPRARLRRVQTPQAFRASTIRRAYALARKDPDFTATDDCSVVLHYLPDVPIHVVDGSERNIKVTFPIDLLTAEQLFRLSTRTTEEATDASRAGR